jgi:hypothetical protein
MWTIDDIRALDFEIIDPLRTGGVDSWLVTP